MLKKAIISSRAGLFALSVRDSYDRLRSAYSNPEVAGTVANDWLAGHLLKMMCKPHHSFVDVGSHIGSVISGVMHSCPTVHIIAFEAVPQKCIHLRQKFPNVELHSVALGDADGEATFFVFVDTKRSGFSSLERPAAGTTDTMEIQVPIKRLDSLITSKNVDVIKIDVEGAELGVLRGGARVLDECRPTVMFESGPGGGDGLGFTKEAMWDFFESRGYAILVPNRVAHNDPGLSREGFVESHLYPRRTTNYFAVARERREEVQHRTRDLLK